MTNPGPEVENVTLGPARMWHFQLRVVLFQCPTNDYLSYVLSYGQLQESWIISGLQWRNVNEYGLPSKNAHCPNYCSWLAVCVNYSDNFCCKIALINRFKLYLIKTYSKTPKKQKKHTEHEQKQLEYILRLHLVTVKRWTYDNAECHVTAFRPISEAAHSWSYDK